MKYPSSRHGSADMIRDPDIKLMGHQAIVDGDGWLQQGVHWSPARGPNSLAIVDLDSVLCVVAIMHKIQWFIDFRIFQSPFSFSFISLE